MRSIVSTICMMMAASLALAAPVLLTHVSAEMLSPGFWIKEDPTPDKVVMSKDRIHQFNAAQRAQGLVMDLEHFPSQYDAEQLKQHVLGLVDELKTKPLFNAKGFVVSGQDYALLLNNMALFALPRVVLVKKAVTVSFASERFLPQREGFYESPGDIYFDQLQNSGLDPLTPVVVLHQSVDGQWVFVMDAISKGWVRAQDVAYVSDDVWESFWQDKDALVVISRTAAIYSDSALNNPMAKLRMGSRFKGRITKGVVELMYPARLGNGDAFWRPVFLNSKDVAEGALPYNTRNIYTQAFKMLDAPYGWGDAGQNQDCSRLMQMIFATVGLELPRNSKEQAMVGREVSLPKAEGALSLLKLNGHIMLYLGEVDGRHYAIHAAWSYIEKNDVRVPLKRVVISDLSLGEESSKGSFLKRLMTVRYLGD